MRYGEQHMGKKKNTPPAADDMPSGFNAMQDLNRLLAKQNFQSKAEIEAFMQKMQDEGIPEFEPDGAIEEAEELVLEGYTSETPRAIELARQALELDHECIGAFDLLGRCETLVAVRICYFKRGVDLGRELFDEEFTAMHRGHFWLHLDTRPFMRCMQGYAESLFYLGDLFEAMDTWIDMIDLNPGDNLGVRQYLLLTHAGLIMEKEFKELDKRYKDDAFCSTLYNRALMAFTAKRKNADKLLRDAIQQNPHVVDLLLAEEEPDAQGPGSVMLGSREEAMGYTDLARSIWENVPDCMEWVERVAKEPRQGAMKLV